MFKPIILLIILSGASAVAVESCWEYDVQAFRIKNMERHIKELRESIRNQQSYMSDTQETSKLLRSSFLQLKEVHKRAKSYLSQCLNEITIRMRLADYQEVDLGSFARGTRMAPNKIIRDLERVTRESEQLRVMFQSYSKYYYPHK